MTDEKNISLELLNMKYMKIYKILEKNRKDFETFLELVAQTGSNNDKFRK